MFPYNQDALQVIKTELSLNSIGTGIHIIRKEAVEFKHFVKLIWIAEIHYFKSLCYVALSYSSSYSTPKGKKCVLFVPTYHQKPLVTELSDFDEKVTESLSNVKLNTLGRGIPSPYRLDLEIHALDGYAGLSFDLMSENESYQQITAELIRLVEWIVNQYGDKRLSNFLKTRNDHEDF